MQEEIRPAEPHDRQCDSLSAPTERLGRDVQLGQALAQGVAIYTQQASRTQVVVALGYYSVVGVPSQTIRLDELRSGRWRLTLPEG